MPTDSTDQRLDWTEENLSKVVSEIYTKAGSDKAFYDKLLSEPFEVLNARIKVPDNFNGKVFARQKNKKMFILNVPSYDEADKADPAANQMADYQILCTVLPW